MLYYARINGKVVGPLGRSELIRLRDDGTLGAEGQWCEADSEIWQSPKMIVMLPEEEISDLQIIVTICNWGLLLLTPLFFLLPVIDALRSRFFFSAYFLLYALLYVTLILTQKIRWLGLLFYGLMLFLIAQYTFQLSDSPPSLPKGTHTQTAMEPTPDLSLSATLARKMPWDDQHLPYIQPLNYPPTTPGDEGISMHLRHTPTQFCEFREEMEKLVDVFSQHNEQDTLTVERAQYFAQNMAQIPYQREARWQNLFETLKKREGNCAAKSIALYDMMMRGGAKNVYWIVGMSYKRDDKQPPVGHAWIYWEKDGKNYIIECASYLMFHDITEIQGNSRLREYYGRYWPRWGISDGKFYVFGR